MTVVGGAVQASETSDRVVSRCDSFIWVDRWDDRRTHAATGTKLGRRISFKCNASNYATEVDYTQPINEAGRWVRQEFWCFVMRCLLLPSSKHTLLRST
jgi:hypothetical protein